MKKETNYSFFFLYSQSSTKIINKMLINSKMREINKYIIILIGKEKSEKYFIKKWESFFFLISI
jgi:hypothetical protein